MGGFLIGKLIVMAIPKNAMFLTVTDYRDLLRTIRKIEPGMMKEFRREVRKIGTPMRQTISAGIPKTATVSHMTPEVNKIGRLAWGAGVAPDKAVLDTRIPSRKKKGTSLIRVVVSSPATVMADMAGRSGKYIGRRQYAGATKQNAMTVPTGKYKGEMGYAYTYRNGVVAGRKHRNTGGQGRGMIRNLGKRPSRYVWSSAEKSLPATRLAMLSVVNKYANEVTQMLRNR